MAPVRILPSILALALLLPVIAVPHAAAALPPCTDAADLTVANTHLVEDRLRAEAWQEVNELPGLQTAECHAGGFVYGADAFLATIDPTNPNILGLCTFFPVYVCL